MALEDRDWFREQKLPDEATRTGDWHLVEDADGYRLEHRERHTLGWSDVLLWLVLLVIVNLLG